MQVGTFKSEAGGLGRVLALVFLLICALAGAVLLVPAVLVGGLLLVMVVVWARIRRGLARLLPDRSGRQNVRVVERPD